MSHPMAHSKNSARKWGGVPEDYLPLHDWFDETKAWFAGMQHRAIRHHAEGIFELEKLFGHTITNSDGKEVYVRYIGEQHVIEDLGFIPTASDWFKHLDMQKWMMARDQELKRKMNQTFGEEQPESVRDLLTKYNMTEAETHA